jgi:hypothetical protein
MDIFQFSCLHLIVRYTFVTGSIPSWCDVTFFILPPPLGLWIDVEDSHPNFFLLYKVKCEVVPLLF